MKLSSRMALAFQPGSFIITPTKREILSSWLSQNAPVFSEKASYCLSHREQGDRFEHDFFSSILRANNRERKRHNGSHSFAVFYRDRFFWIPPTCSSVRFSSPSSGWASTTELRPFARPPIAVILCGFPSGQSPGFGTLRDFLQRFWQAPTPHKTYIWSPCRCMVGRNE